MALGLGCIAQDTEHKARGLPHVLLHSPWTPSTVTDLSGDQALSFEEPCLKTTWSPLNVG